MTRTDALAYQGAACDTGFRSYFAHPRGWRGWLAGELMALENGDRGRWVIARLELEPGDHVLEVGCGAGADLRRAARSATRGRLVGVDPSAVMVRSARRRNAGAMREGRVEVLQAAAESLPLPAALFDVAFTINAFPFWSDRGRALAEMRRVLVPGGRIAVAVQPRSPDATAETSRRTARELRTALEAAGLEAVRAALHDVGPVPIACAMGRRPSR